MADTYFWQYEGPEHWDLVAQLAREEISVDDFLKADRENGGTSQDFCEYFKAVAEAARKYYPPVVVAAMLRLLPALEAGDLKSFKVGDIHAWIGREIEA